MHKHKNILVSQLKYIVILINLFISIAAWSENSKATLPASNHIYYLNISRTDAATALNILAQQTKTTLVYSYALAEKVETNALHGYFTLDKALKYALINTGLTFKRIDGQIVISPVVTKNNTSLSNSADKKVLMTPSIPLESVEIIQIVGQRASLYKAQDIKRHASTIVDAIVSEDIGRLPDITSADSVSHLPGIQVERYNDEVNRVLLRGSANFTTTYNGREFFTAELRTARLQDFSSQSISQIEVHKTSTANFIETGLTGVVNIKTHKPLDFDERKVIAGLSASYNDQIDKASPSAYFLFSDRWNTSIGTVGFLANIAQASAEYYNGVKYNATSFSILNNLDGAIPDSALVMPTSVGLYNNGGYRKRPSFNTAIQWQPNSHSEFYFDAIYQGFESGKYVDHLMFNLTGTEANAKPAYLTDVITSNAITSDKPRQVTGITKSDGRRPYSYRSTSLGKTDTFQAAIGGSWAFDQVTIKTDFANTDSQYSDKHWSLDSAFSTAPQGIINFTGKHGANFSFKEFNAADINQYLLRGYYESDFLATGNATQWQTDLIYNPNINVIEVIETGIRLTNRNMQINRGTRYANLLDLAHPLGDSQFLDFALTKKPYRHNSGGFNQYLAATRDSIENNHTQLAALAYNSLLELNSRGDDWSWAGEQAQYWQSAKVAIEPAYYLHGNEQIQALYLQTKLHTLWSGININSILGVRVVKTDVNMTANVMITQDGQSTIEPSSQQNSYINTLPNININLELTDELILRLAYGKTLTRTEFINYSPSKVFTVNNDGLSGNEFTGSGGNPNLKPTLSNNYDTSLEYYFADNGYVSGAIFYRDINGIVINQSRYIQTDDLGSVWFRQPQNSGQSYIVGAETSIQSFFNFLPKPFDGFGITANLALQEGKQRDLNTENSQYRDITGLSKWTYNMALLFEQGKFSSHFIYNYRSGWTNWFRFDTDINQTVTNKTYARDKLDLSINYDINQYFSLNGYISNILAKPLRNYTYIEQGQVFPQDVRDEGRYFSLGIVVKF